MKVLLQHPVRPDEISGVGTFIRNTRDLLVRSGVEVRTLATKTASREEIKDGVAWADVVHLSSNHGRTFLLAKLSGKPIVLHYHYPFWGTWKTEQHRALNFWQCWTASLRFYWGQGKGRRFDLKYLEYFGAHVGRSLLRVLMCATADARVTPSTFMREDTKIPWPVEVIPLGLNFTSMDRWSNKPFPRTASFCFIGRITPVKGLSCLLEAAALVKQQGIALHLDVIGEGDDLEASKKLAKTLGLESDVTFHGRLEWEKALDVLTDCAVLVLPSNYDEAAGYVWTEAYALKGAVIGSHRGGIPEQVGPGLIFQAPDHHQLAEHMARLARDPKLAKELADKGYHFALQRCRHADHYVALYRRLAPETA